MAKRGANGEGSIRKRPEGRWEGRYTVGQWMDVWFENYAKIKVRPSSHQTYRGYIDNHIKPNIGKIQLNKLTTLELQKFYKKLLSKDSAEHPLGCWGTIQLDSLWTPMPT